MPTYYLYPTAISIDDLNFPKVDLEIGSGQFVESDFAIIDFGSLTDLSISVDRINGNVTKSINANDIQYHTSGAEFLVSDTSSVPNYLDLNSNYLESDYNNSFRDTNTEPKEILAGALFNCVIKQLFPNATNTSIVDFTDPSFRQKKIFFDTDGTVYLVSDLINKTSQALNDVVTTVTNPSEVLYWSGLTHHTAAPEETNTIAFENGDKLMIYYTLTLTFVVPTTNNLSNLDIVDQSNISFVGPFQNASVNTSFVLGWDIWITGNNGEINNSGGPLQDMTVRAYVVNNGVINTLPLEPPCITDNRGKVVIHPGWGLQVGDEFVCKTVNESGNAIDTTLVDENDPFSASPSMSLSGYYVYNGVETINVTPTTSLVFTLIEESASGFNATSLATAKQDIDNTFGIDKNTLYDDHNDTEKDELLNFVMELNSAAMSLNDITTEENEAVSQEISPSVFKGIADVIKTKSNASETIDLADDSVGGAMEEIIQKVSRRRHGTGPNDNSINTSNFNKPDRRLAMRRFIIRNRNQHLFGQSVSPIADKQARRRSRIRMKKLQMKMQRRGTRISADLTDAAINAMDTSMEDPVMVSLSLIHI